MNTITVLVKRRHVFEVIDIPPNVTVQIEDYDLEDVNPDSWTIHHTKQGRFCLSEYGGEPKSPDPPHFKCPECACTDIKTTAFGYYFPNTMPSEGDWEFVGCDEGCPFECNECNHEGAYDEFHIELEEETACSQ